MNEMNRLIEIMSEMLTEQREMKATFTARFDQVDARLDRMELGQAKIKGESETINTTFLTELEGDVNDISVGHFLKLFFNQNN